MVLVCSGGERPRRRRGHALASDATIASIDIVSTRQPHGNFHRASSTESIVMAIDNPVRRLLVRVGIAAAAGLLLTLVPAVTDEPTASAQPCVSGEEPDPLTGTCVPHLVPRTPQGTIPGNPDVPAVLGRPCTTPAECARLGRDPGTLPPQPIPHSKTGHDGNADSHP